MNIKGRKLEDLTLYTLVYKYRIVLLYCSITQTIEKLYCSWNTTTFLEQYQTEELKLLIRSYTHWMRSVIYEKSIFRKNSELTSVLLRQTSKIVGRIILMVKWYTLCVFLSGNIEFCMNKIAIVSMLSLIFL